MNAPTWRNWVPIQPCYSCLRVIWQGWRYPDGVVCQPCESAHERLDLLRAAQQARTAAGVVGEA